MYSVHFNHVRHPLSGFDHCKLEDYCSLEGEHEDEEPALVEEEQPIVSRLQSLSMWLLRFVNPLLLCRLHVELFT